MSSHVDFDTPIDRRLSDSYKWDRRPSDYPDDVLPMWVADMDFAVAQPIVEAVAERLTHPVFGYTFSSRSYLEAFLSWQHVRNNWEIDDTWVCDAPGVVPAIRAAILGLTEPGDGVIIQTPTYHVFFHTITENDRQVVENRLIEVDGSYRMDLDDLRDKLRDGARMVLLCSPHNPVGRVWSRNELIDLAEVCLQFGATVVADEIHSDIILTDRQFVPFASLGRDVAEITIGCYSPSKTFNLASLSAAQIVVAEGDTRRRFSETVKRLGLSGHNALSLAATEAAYNHGGRWANALCQYLRESSTLISAQLPAEIPEIEVCPVEGTYLAWIDFRKLLRRRAVSEKQFHRALVESGRLWLSRGKEFGSTGDGFFRMNFACPRSTVTEGIARIVRTVESLS